MNGLLGSIDDPRTAGLLGLGLRLMSTPGKFGQALGQSGLGAMGDMRQAQQSQDQRKRAGLQEQLVMLQLQQAQQQQEQQRQAQAAAAAQEQQRRGFLGSMDSSAGPAMPFDPMRAYGAGFRPEEIKFMAEAGNMGRQKVARTLEVDDGKGGKRVVQLDEFGAEVGPGMPGYVAPVQVNQGDKVTFTKPQAGVSLPVGMSPGDKDASSRGWASLALQRQAEARQAVDAVTGPKPPAGYRFKPDGSLEAIPGGPADIKAGAEGAKAEAKKASTVAAAKGVLGTIKEAENLVGINTAGVGSWMSALPATDARDLAAKLETVKANLGFDRLQQMRDQSPTGGALGAVAVQELVALQSTVASLDQAQSPSQLRASLKKIEGHYKRWLATMGEKDAPMPQVDTAAGVPAVKFLGFE